MADINFGILDTQLPGRIAAIPQEAQKQQTANMLQAMQMQGAMREGQMSQMKIDEMVAERKEIDASAAKLKARGYVGGLRDYLTESLSSRNPERVKQGYEGLRRLDLQDEFNTLFKGSLGAMFGAAPAPGAATPTTAESAPTPGSFGADVAARTAAVPEWARPASTPAPMNAMLGNAPSVNNLARQGASVEDMERMVLGLGKYSKDVPGAETVSKLLEEKIKAARAITTVAPGTTALRDGVPMYTAPTSFETMLANSELTTEAKVLARKALINKETNIAQPEFIDNLRALAEAKDPATRTFLTNRLNYLTTHRLPTNVVTNVKLPPAEGAYSTTFAKNTAEEDIKLLGSARNASKVVTTANRIMELLAKPDIFVGPASTVKLNIARALNVLGADETEEMRNTEKLIAASGQGTLDAIKDAGLGTGQGFTTKDLIFLQGVAGGTVELTAENLKTMARLQHRAAELSVKKWLARRGTMPESATKGTGIDKETYELPTRIGGPPPEAITYLKANPNTKAAFDKKFGDGEAEHTLRMGK